MKNIKTLSVFESKSDAGDWKPTPESMKNYMNLLKGVDLQSLVGKTVRIIEVGESLSHRDEKIVEISEYLSIRTRKGTDNYGLGFALTDDVKKFVKEGIAWLHPNEVMVVLIKE